MPFQQPAHTRFDLKFKILGIPVRVHPAFWLMGIIFGSASGDFIQLLIWVVVVFISILIHELGHSMAMRGYGVRSSIVLYIFGGLAIPEPSYGYGGGRNRETLSLSQGIIISLAGPFAGFFLAAIVVALVWAAGGYVYWSRMFVVIPLPVAYLPEANWVVNSVISTTLWINVFWGAINLMPVFPLDGGRVARNVFIKFDPWKGVRNSLWLSVLAGVIVAVAGYVFLNSIYMAFLFGMLAFQSYQMLQGRTLL